ncbi:aspartic peptidase domain containing protein [Nitzschia inconspicua]|uniref:Aspartic peptidase domain containing protein n=1 Tax=Nitzschia inconspicua TaxID=303405 RepID=A0A9K3LPG7_9STRA|nr:aspartic peptidase domain containing protein [Nitzschia inconspicua]
MNLLWRFLNWTFSQKFVGNEDPRVPIEFHIWEWKVRILPPSVVFMIQVIWIVFLCMILGCVLSTLLFFRVIQPSRRNDPEPTRQQPSQKTTSTPAPCTTQGLLIGFGVVLPLTLLIPYHAINEFDIRNLGFRLAWVSLPMTMILRTFEAVFGFTSPQHSRSLWSFVRHTGFVLRPHYTDNGGTKAATLSSVSQILKEYLFWVAFLAVAYHCFASANFCPLTRLVGTEFETSRIVYWDAPHLYDTFLQACLMNVTLSLSMTGASALGSLLTGVQMDDKVTQYPMFLSESVSDFWGRRWNNLIHVALKQGVYKPVRHATQSKSLASLAAFVVSGLCHEYVWMMLYFPTSAQLAAENAIESTCCLSCYCQTWTGKQLIFFGWNGVLVALEYLLGDQVSRYSQCLPRVMRSHLIVLLALPVGHLFTYDITHAGYFDHLTAAVPAISVIGTPSRRLSTSDPSLLSTAIGLLALSGTFAEKDELPYDNRQLLGLRGGIEGSVISSGTGRSQTASEIPVANITIPLHFHSGSHHAHMYIGSPPQRQTLIIDTGSKAMAFPCKTCKKCSACCGSHASPYFDPEVSTTHRVSKCGSCLLEGISSCSLFGDLCTFSQKYTEGSSWTATEVEDVVWLGTPDVVECLEDHMGTLAIPYSFGCQTSSKGLFRKQYADGILGLSIHDSSLIRALYLEGLIPRNAFSLCFTHVGGHLSLGGSLPVPTQYMGGMTTTPITHEHGYYSVEVVSLSIGEKIIISKDLYSDLLDDMNSGKGCIFDSGTTDSFFPSSLRKVVGDAVMAYSSSLTDFSTTMRRHTYTFEAFQRLPSLTIGFANNANLTILPDHYMEGVPVDSSTGRAEVWEKSIPLTNRIYLDEARGTVLGANAMYGHDIVFDVQGHQIGIATANCHSNTISSQL